MKLSISLPISLPIHSKKGIYFTLEAVIALMVISIGFGILLYMFVVSSKPPVSAVQTELYDTVEIFNMNIENIANGSCSATSDFVSDGNITDTTNTLFNQLGEFYYRYEELGCDYCDEILIQCIADFVDYRNLDEQNIQISIENTVWYKNSTIEPENATVLFPFKMLLFGTYNNSQMWGPYSGEVRLWR